MPRIDKKFLKAEMIRKEIGIVKLAKLTGLSVGTVGYLFTSDFTPRITTISKVCKALDISPEEILLTE